MQNSPLIWKYSISNWRYWIGGKWKKRNTIKVHLFWEGHKIHPDSTAHHRTNLRWRFCKLLWPFQNIWTLSTVNDKIYLYSMHLMIIITYTYYLWYLYLALNIILFIFQVCRNRPGSDLKKKLVDNWFWGCQGAL